MAAGLARPSRINPGAGQRAEQALLADPARGNLAIASEAGCGRVTVQRVRKRLESGGQIPVIHVPGRPWSPWKPHQARQRAAAELRKDPIRSDYVIAQAAQVSPDTVATTRRILVSMYQIGDVPVSQRERRPMPLVSSRTRDAITRLPPDATYRQVARAAGVSPQAAFRMLKTTPRMGDMAAAVDSLSVLKVITRPCGYCRQPFTPASSNLVYCRPECEKAAAARRAHLVSLDLGQSPPPSADPYHPPPPVPVLPPAPDFSKGLCTTVRPSQRTWWSSEDRTEQEAARLMCRGCPVLADCTQWSLALPLSDPAIYGGMTPYERRKRRREWLLAIAAQVKNPRRE